MIDWTLKRLFEREIKRLCPVSESTTINLSIHGDTESFTLSIPSPLTTTKSSSTTTYKLNATSPPPDIGVSWSPSTSRVASQPVFEVKRYTTGFGQEHGGLAIDLYNRGDKPVNVTVFQMVPWFVKMYLHTLTIDGARFLDDARVGEVNWQAGVERGRPNVLEMNLMVEMGKTSLLIDFDKAFIRFERGLLTCVGIRSIRRMRIGALISPRSLSRMGTVGSGIARICC
jgi:phosphatidylinositol glycan class T